jgi:hypothetical protein
MSSCEAEEGWNWGSAMRYTKVSLGWIAHNEKKY